MTLLSSIPARAVSLAALTLALSTTGALFSSARAETQPVFPAAAELVTVDVLVLDDRGRPLEGLSQSDFRIEEDGRPQVLTSFEALRLGASAPAAPPTRARLATNLDNLPAARAFMVVFDDANLSPPSALRARAALTTWVRDSLRPGDDVTLVPTLGGPWWNGRLPADEADLVARLARFEGRLQGDSSPGRLADYEAQDILFSRDPQSLARVARRYYESGLIPDSAPSGDIARELAVSPGLALIKAKASIVYKESGARVSLTLRALERVARALEGQRGRKTVLLVSDGFVRDPLRTEFRSFLEAARRSNTVVHFVDTRGLEGSLGQSGLAGGSAEFGDALEERDTTTSLAYAAAREAEGARSIAADTGGSVITGTARLAEALQRVTDEARAHYLLGYSSTNTRHDGAFRKIEVRVARPDVRVRARRGYYAPSDKPAAPTPKGALAADVRAGLDSPFASAALPLRLATHVFGPAAPDKHSVLLVADLDVRALDLRANARGLREAVLETYAVITPRDAGEPELAEKLVELAVPADAWTRLEQEGLPLYREFQLGPGRYQARLLVRDRASGRLGSVRQEFEVAPTGQPRTSTPVLTDALQAAGPGGPARPRPVARRDFAVGARLYHAFEAYDLGPGAVEQVRVTYELRAADGSVLLTPETRVLRADALGRLAQVFAFVAPNAPGDYELLVGLRTRDGLALDVRDALHVR
jgi:VWFA-related protein